MTSKFYDLKLVRANGTEVAKLAHALDLDDVPGSATDLRRLLADAIRRNGQRLEDIRKFGLEVRERGRRHLAIPVFHATFEQVKDLK